MIRLLVGVSLFLLMLAGSARAVELVGAPVVTPNGGVGNVTVTWQTDVACGTRLSLGTELDKLETKVEGEVTATHNVALTGLKPATEYYYAVGSARQQLGAGSFTVPPVNGTSLVPAAPGVTPSKSILDRVRDALPTKPRPHASVSPAQAPPTSMTWGNRPSLPDHFARHGADFQSRSPDDYAAKAWFFLQRARAESLPMKLDADVLRVYDPATGAFAAYNLDGTTKTYFKPNNPTYWQRQPGRLIKPAQLPPSLQSSRSAP